jgi:RNA polymerase-binding protein DksA
LKNSKTKAEAAPSRSAKLPKGLTEAEIQKLHEERALTLAELERLRAYLQTAPEPTGDEADLDVYEREKNLALVKSLERKLESIDYALRAAIKGAYGICERCGNPIDPARLKILPETTLCVNCKNALEKTTRRTTTGFDWNR